MANASGRTGLFKWLDARRRPGAPSLGQRELAIMQVLWAHGEVSAQEVLEHLAAQGLTLNTVCTTLERLTRKGLLARVPRTRPYRYEALMERRTLIGLLLRDIGEEIAGGDLAPMVSGFVDYLGADPRGDAELRRLVDGAPEEDQGHRDR